MFISLKKTCWASSNIVLDFSLKTFLVPANHKKLTCVFFPLKVSLKAWGWKWQVMMTKVCSHFWKQTHLWTTPRVKGGSVLAEFRPFFILAVPQLFFFFFFLKRKHFHTDLLKKFRLKETVFEKLEPFSWIPYVFFGRQVLSAWLRLMLGILNWWNTALLIPFLRVVFTASVRHLPLSPPDIGQHRQLGGKKMCHQKTLCCGSKVEMASRFDVMWKWF